MTHITPIAWGLEHRSRARGWTGKSVRRRPGACWLLEPWLSALAGLLVGITGIAPARESVVEFNTKPVPPNIDVLWQVSISGEFVEVAARENVIALTANSGKFSFDQVRLNPIGGADRPAIAVSATPPYWTSKFDPYGVVKEITVHQEITRGTEKQTVNIPIAVKLLEQRVETLPVLAEFRNMRVQGTPESQNVDYTFTIAVMGTYCPNDITFFVRSDSTRSFSGSTETRGEFQPVKETLQAGTTLLLKDIRVSLFGRKPEDRQGVFLIALVGRDTKGNLVTAQCEVPLRPPWATPGAAETPAPPAR